MSNNVQGDKAAAKDAPYRLVRQGEPVGVTVARGNVGGTTPLHKFGRNGALPNGSWAPIVEGGTINWLQAADEVRVKAGGNANDTVAGSGARKVMVVGLDENWDPAEEEVDLAGASASATTTTKFIRVYRAYVTEVGTYGGVNADDIEIETEAGTSLIIIAAGECQSQFCAYSTGRYETLLLTRGFAQVPSSKSADLRLMVRSNANNVTTFSPPRVVGIRDEVNDQAEAQWDPPQQIPPYSDIWVEGYGNGVGVETNAEFDGYVASSA